LPAREVPPRGATPVDPHHSHIVAVDDPAWPSAESAWGAETAAMFTVFAQLSAGRAAVALLANGGAIALDEVARHVRAGRRVIVLAGTGRAADAIAHGLGRRGGAGGVDEADGGGGPDVVALMREVERRQILASPDAFVVVPVEDGPDALAEAMLEQL